MSELRISPAERFEVLVDFSDGKGVVLETGPDRAMGIFGAISDSGTNDYVPVMRFEPTAAAAEATAVSGRLLPGMGTTREPLASIQARVTC